MDTTLTIRLSKVQREALKRRAAAERKGESALVREIIEREIDKGFDFEAVRHLVGSVESKPKREGLVDSWREQIRDRNWRR